MATYENKSTVRAVPDLQNDIKSLSEFSTRKKIADFAIAFDKEDNEIFAFENTKE
jgi:DNA polymerase-3 subunit epsilon